MSWRQFLKSDTEVLRVKRVLSPPVSVIVPLPTLKTLKNPEIEIEKIPVEVIPQWQHDFCIAHAMFKGWQDHCPCSIDDCLISKIIDSEANIDNLRGFEVGQGITSDKVINEWLDTGEPGEDVFKNPAWLICMAEHIRKHKEGGYDVKIT